MKMKKFIYELKQPAYTINRPMFGKIISFGYCKEKKIFIFGFDTGEVIII